MLVETPVHGQDGCKIQGTFRFLSLVAPPVVAAKTTGLCSQFDFAHGEMLFLKKDTIACAAPTSLVLESPPCITNGKTQLRAFLCMMELEAYFPTMEQGLGLGKRVLTAFCNLRARAGQIRITLDVNRKGAE